MSALFGSSSRAFFNASAAAAASDGDEWRHVLLISPAVEGGKKRWFVLGYGSSAQIVDESALRPIPVKWSPRPGDVVWAEWVGTMRRATVQGIDAPAFFTVKYERAGRPATIGWGLLMDPVTLDGARGPGLSPSPTP